MAEAKYFHSTLYRFAPQAYSEVISRFNAVIDDVSARCWYDTTQDVFCLKSPGQIGHLANTALNEVLSQYEAEEFARAEREDREPHISSFEDAALESEPSGLEPNHAQVSDIHSTAPLPTQHCINLEGNSASKVKLFRLRDLPAGLVDRILSPEEGGARKACQSGVTARIVAWNSRNEVYIFNGRFGSPIDVSGSSTLKFIYAGRFDRLSDLLPSTELPNDANNAPAKTWKLKNDQSIDIKRFLEGMGELEFEDSEVEPVKTADAARFLKNPTLPDLPYGRPRVPAKSQSSGEDSNVDSDDDSKSVHSASSAGSDDGAPSGMQLLIGTTADDQKTPTLANPFPALSSQLPVQPPGDTGSSVLRTSSPESSSNSSHVLPPHLRNRRSKENSTGSSHADGLPYYDRAYAQVDRTGLSGIAGNQAAWEHENPTITKKNTTNKSGITRRIHESGAASNTASQSHGQQILSSAASSSSSSMRTPTVQVEYTTTPQRCNNKPGTQKWENIIVRPTYTGPKLIDDTSPSKPNAKVKIPPGLEQFGKFETKASSTTNERLQAMPDVANEKKHTMNQRARKPKSKKPSATTKSASNAVLPMPDPIPVPNRKITKEPAAGLTTFDMVSYSSGDEESSPPTPMPHLTTLENFLGDLSLAGIINGKQIHVSFGMALSTQEGAPGTFQKGIVSKEQLETKLQACADSIDTTFLTRLTTSTTDAVFLLDLMPGSPVVAEMQYEIVVKNAEGSHRRLTVDQTDRHNYQVDAASETIATHNIHYPIRVWDAWVVVEKPVPDYPTSAATEFVCSMQTVGEAPSFLAMIPQASFSVEKIYAKRYFTKTVAGGFELTVTEVQDLMLESVSDARYNVKASALPAEEMAGAQRLWWECSLRSEVVDGESATLLQQIIDTMVTNMDGVGFHNKGPWQKAEVNEGHGVVDQWFW